MSRKKTPEFVVGEAGQRWNLDDFDLDSHGVEAPIRERLESLMRGGYTPEQVSVEIRDKYTNYRERMKKKKSKDEKKAEKARTVDK
jgi:hypothetical protein